MAIIQVTAFMIAVLLLAYLFKESFVSVLPGAACGLILLLYALALCGHLSLIDCLSVGVLAGTGLWLLAGKRKDVLHCWRLTVSEPSFWASLLMVCAVTFCVSGKLVTWWDDINFWATDVKSLYYLDGFAHKYGNVAPEFGDYPPATQLFKWWFLHMDRHTFREGLAFAGYHTLNLFFLFPLFQKKNKSNIAEISCITILTAVALWLFPSITEIYGYHGFCADLTMACIYGNFLYAVTDRSGHSEWFYNIRLILYLGVLVLVKSVGFIWAAFGLIFFFLYQTVLGGRASSVKNKKGRFNPIFPIAVTIAPLLTGGSWMAFCLFMRRVTKTTATAVKYITTDDYTWSLYGNEFARAFVKAFFTEPLHKEHGWGIDLTPFGFYLLICALVFFFGRKRLLSGRQGHLALWFSIVSGAVMYGIIFLAHLTIFANETQYLEATAMVSSIERYGAPFTVGTLLFLSLLWMERGDAVFNGSPILLKKYGKISCFLLLVFLTAGWSNSYDGLIGYRSRTAEDIQTREDMTDERSMRFLAAIEPLGNRESTRVLYIQSDESERWVRNSYTNFMASPVSVVYLGVDLNGDVNAYLTDLIRSAHAAYLYADQPDADADAAFADMMQEGSFAMQTLYRIEDDGARIRLCKTEERYGE